MNRFLYTLLIAAISVGLTLAFSSACRKKCACDTADGAQNEAAMQLNTKDETSEGSGSTRNRASSGGFSSNDRNENGNGGAAGASQDQQLHKYGDAETGGNVYMKGGISPGQQTGTVTNSSTGASGGSGTTSGGGAGSGPGGTSKQKTGNSGGQKN